MADLTLDEQEAYRTYHRRIRQARADEVRVHYRRRYHEQMAMEEGGAAAGKVTAVWSGASLEGSVEASGGIAGGGMGMTMTSDERSTLLGAGATVLFLTILAAAAGVWDVALAAAVLAIGCVALAIRGRWSGWL